MLKNQKGGPYPKDKFGYSIHIEVSNYVSSPSWILVPALTQSGG